MGARTVLGATAIGFLLCGFGLLNCGHCSPVPTPVVDAADPTKEDAPKDIFWGITADCSLFSVAGQRAQASEPVRKCLDAIDVGPCFVQLADTLSKDTIVCVVQEFDMSLHQSMAKGTATEAMKVEAAAASKWIRATNVGIRN